MADEKDVKIKIIVDTSQVTKLDKVKKSLSSLGTDVDKTAKTARTFSKNWGASFRSAYSEVKKFGVGSQEYTERISHDNSYLAQSARKFARAHKVSLESSMSLMRGVGATSNKEWKGVGVDMKKGEKYAKELSEGFGVSLDVARKYEKNLGLQVKESSTELKTDMKSVGERAKVMSKDWGVSINKAVNYQKNLVKEVKNGGIAITKSVKGMAQGFAYHLTFIAWHFRYLGNILGRFSRQWYQATKKSIETASELQESFLSIKTASALFGQSADKAISFTKKLALTGLVPLTDAANEVKNLMVAGLGVPEMEQFAERYLDYAFLMTSGGNEMAKSFKTITERVLRGGSALIKDVAASRIWTETNNRLNKTLGVGLQQLSAKRRALEVLKTIEADYAGTVGFHAIEENTLRAALNKVKTSITLLYDAYGRALGPALLLIADYLRKLTTYLTDLIPKIDKSILLFTGLGIAITAAISAISFGMGVLISFYNIIKGLSTVAGLAVVPFGKIALIALGVGAILTGVTYLILRHTGAWDKMKKSLEDIENQIAKTKDELEGLQSTEEEGIGITKKETIAHERKTADIMEDLERERSKGLWANQMTIKDLEKRLKREDEDWAMLQTDKEKMSAQDTAETKKKSKWEIMTQVEKLKQIVDDTKKSFQDLDKIYTSWFSKIGKKIAELPPIWQAALGGVATYIAAIGIPALIKLSSRIGALGPLAKATFAKIGIAFAGLRTTLSTPIALTILVGAAILAISAVLQHFKLVNLAITDQQKAIHEAGNYWDEYMRKQSEMLRQGEIGRKQWQESFKMSQEAMNAIRETLISPTGGRGIWGTIKGGPSAWAEAFGIGEKQFGGIVPGMRNQPVPIIAHGGERVIPAGEVRGGENVTININASVRNDNDIREIARQVSQAMGQRQKWSRLGALG